MARGNRRKKIFRSETDYNDYLLKLKEYHNKLGFVLYAYCLMPNHVHFLMETKEAPLSKIMQRLQFRYTQSFNKRHRTTGHVFQGRYKAILCDKNEYLLQLIRYIHYNPVRAKIIAKPQDYRWSSHFEIVGINKRNICDINSTLSIFHNNKKMAKRLYDNFMCDEEINHKKELYITRNNNLLGDDDFIKEAICKSSDFQTCKYKISIDEIIHIVSEQTDIVKQKIKSKRRTNEGSYGRSIVTYIATHTTNNSLTEIARHYNQSCENVSISYGKIQMMIESNNYLKKIITEILAYITLRYPKDFNEYLNT